MNYLFNASSIFFHIFICKKKKTNILTGGERGASDGNSSSSWKTSFFGSVY